MNDDYATYRQRVGRSVMKRASVGYLKAVVGAGAGFWLAERLHETGAITAGDENLLTVVLAVWLAYGVLRGLVKIMYGQWLITMPPVGEIVGGVRQRVGIDR